MAQVPGHEIHSRPRARAHRANQRATRVGDLDPGGVFRLTLEGKGDPYASAPGGANAGARRKEVQVAPRYHGVLLLERRDVVQDEHPAPVGAHHDIVIHFRHDNPADRCRGEPFTEPRPADAVVHRVVERVARTGENHSLAIRIFGDAHDVGERMLAGQRVADPRPALPEVRGLEDEWFAVVHHVIVHRDVRRAGVEMRRFDFPDGPPGCHAGDVLRQVAPRFATVPGVPDFSVVRPGPDEAALHATRRNGEDDFPVELAEIVGHDAAGRHDAARVARGEIGADHRPVLSLIRRSEDHLTSVVHGVVIEGVDGEWRRPVAPVFCFVRRRIERVHARAHRAREPRAVVVACDGVAVAGCPHDVRVGGIGNREARFAATQHVVPGGVAAAASTGAECSA